jgi:YidC/Oxa1 family membrane protein insertase
MDQKNFIVAIVLSVVIIMGWQTLFPAKHTPPPQEASQTTAPNAPGSAGTAPSAPGTPPSAGPAVQQVVSRAEALAA